MNAIESTREQRARRQAKSIGLAVQKSPRDGTFRLIDPSTRAVVAGLWEGHPTAHGLDIETIEQEIAARR